MMASHTFTFRKLTPLIALITVSALLLAGVLVVVYGERSYREQKADEVGAQARILASSVTAALVFDDQQAAQEYVNAMQANPEVRAAAVYDATGTLFASYSRAEEASLPVAVTVPGTRFEDGRLIVVAPVVQDGETLGMVYLRTVTEPLARRLARYGVIGLLVMMAALVVAIFGLAQAALARANAELERRASDLAEANAELHAQIAEREKAEEALRQSQKMEAIGHLSGGIAHDFNNLLTIILGNLEIARKRIGQGRTDISRQLDVAITGANRGASLTQRILAFSRRQPLSPKPVDLSRLVADTRTLLRHSVNELIEVEMRLEADWWILCDPNQMESLILNLVINARDAMPDGGRLTIETANVQAAKAAKASNGALAEDCVRLSVADTGIGMSEEVRTKAFDPFFTTKPLGQGTGLGLSTIFGYVKQSNGHLDLESVEGEGTRVTILMPRYRGEVPDEAADGRASAPASPGAALASEARTPTVLVVEDDGDVRALAMEAVRNEGYGALEAADGVAAVELLRSNLRIDLLLSDVRLPGMNGFQVAEAGRECRPGLKVLLMTGYAQDPVPEALVRAGATVLHKPFSVEELAGSIRVALGKGGIA